MESLYFRTIIAAKRAGFIEFDRRKHYGGEQIAVKDHLLVRNPKVAVSRTEWKRQGYEVRSDAEPHGQLTHQVGGAAGKAVTYPVFREDQVSALEAKTMKGTQ